MSRVSKEIALMFCGWKSIKCLVSCGGKNPVYEA